MSWVADGLPAWRKSPAIRSRRAWARDVRDDARRRTRPNRTAHPTAAGHRHAGELAGPRLAATASPSRAGSLVYPWPARSQSPSAALATIPTESCYGHGPLRTPIDGGSSASTATPHPARSSACLAVVTSLALIWPAAIAAAQSRSARRRLARPLPRRRTPTANAVGARPRREVTQCQRAAAARPSRSGTERRPRQPRRLRAKPARARGIQARPAASVQATGSGAPAATSFGPWEGIDQATSGVRAARPVGRGRSGRRRPDRQHAAPLHEPRGHRDRTGRRHLRLLRPRDFEITPGDPDLDRRASATRACSTTPSTTAGSASTLGWHCDTDGAGTRRFAGLRLRARSAPPVTRPATTTTSTSSTTRFLPDFPMIGTSGDKFTISANEFTLDEHDRLHAPQARYDGASDDDVRLGPDADVPGPARLHVRLLTTTGSRFDRRSRRRPSRTRSSSSARSCCRGPGHDTTRTSPT